MAKFNLAILLCALVLGQSCAGSNNTHVLHAIVNIMNTAYLQKTPNSDAEDVSYGGLSPEVQTTSGLLYGSNNSYANSFYGIPYAVPPTGNLRFQPPHKLDTPELARNTSVRRLIICSSPTNTLNEDCLVLNVHVPLHVDLTDSKSPPSERLPVLFFIHGGAFVFGSGTITLYEGRFLCQVTDTIVVTVNYRLGPLGFLVFDDGKNFIAGNQGLKDQQLALQWVQDNIEMFGGDKSSVTIFGESAGAQSVMFHLLSNISEPMFHRAIMESNPASYVYPTYEQALDVTDQLVGFLRCNPPVNNRDCCTPIQDNYTCLMEASSENLIGGMLKIMAQAWIQLDVPQALEPFRPCIDEVEFNEQPMALFMKGLWNKKKPVIIGINEEEVNVIKYILPLNELQFRELNQQLFEDIGTNENTGDMISDKYVEMYPNITDYGLLFGMEMTDIFFGCPTRAMARFVSDTSDESIYYYIFSHSLDGEDCEEQLVAALCGHSYHSAELFFVFRTIEHVGMIPDDHDILVSNQFSNYWGNFALTGNPSEGPGFNLDGEFPEWTEYTMRSGQNSHIDRNIRISNPHAFLEQNYREETCDFWDSLGIYPAPPPRVTYTTTEIPTTTSGSIPRLFGAWKLLIMSVILVHCF